VNAGDLGTIVVAVDGTSGSGKSSTCRGVAARLGIRYLDTGAMYRAVTWWLLEHGVDVHDPVTVASYAAAPRLLSGTDPSAPTIWSPSSARSSATGGSWWRAATSPRSSGPRRR
jgi:cytidylate kinase